MLPSLEPLYPLSPVIKVLQEHVEAAGFMTNGRFDQAKQKYLALLEWVTGPDTAGLDQAYREYMRCSFNFALGLLDIGDIPSALDRADAIDQHPIFQVNAWLIRMVYYLRQGEYKKTLKCQQTLELVKLQNGSTHLFEGAQWFTMLLTYALCDDLIGVNQTISRIEEIAIGDLSARLEPDF